MNSEKRSLIGPVIDGDTETVRALLAAGSDVNETGSGGRTPLIMAILFERTQIMTLLLEAGADPERRDSVGLNAADWAERKGLNLLNQSQDLKQVMPRVTPGKEPAPHGLAPSQSENQTHRASGASEQSARDDEKSRRWLAGMKRRIDEEASRKTKQVEPTSPPTGAEAVTKNETPQLLVKDSMVEASAHEAERPVISVPVKPLPNVPPEEPLKNQRAAAHLLASPNGIAISEAASSRATDAPRLVDASRPLFASFTSPREKTWTPLVVLLVVLVLSFIVGAAVTYFMMPSS